LYYQELAMTHENIIEARTHGRYLVSPADRTNAPLLVGFHGYGENAEEELARLCTIPAIEQWTVVSVQGMHQFYRRRTNEIVASWMTRQNRDLAIADNLEYVRSVLAAISAGYSATLRVAFTGFSQGVAMAFRAAALLDQAVLGVIACGGDVPPELDSKALARIPAVLIGRGVRDEWYTAEKVAADEQRLRSAGVSLRALVLDGGHEWTRPFTDASADFLRSLY
jgi:predicted esterase